MDTTGKSRKKRIYVSALENHDTHVTFPLSASELLNRLAEEGFLVVWEKEWREYRIIRADIEASDALLAVADREWHSSTWKAQELSYAIGDKVQDMPIIPAFVYCLGKTWVDGFSKNFPDVITFLDVDVEKAVAQIKSVLSVEE